MKLLHFMAERLLLAVPILFGVTLGAFLLGVIAPSDPALVVLTLDGTSEPSAAELASMREQMGLNEPLVMQFAAWVARVAQGDLGASYITGIPVLESLLYRFPVTLWLSLVALAWVVTLAISAGICAAVRVNRWQDRSLRAVAMVASAIPGFWLAIVLIHYFAERWRLLPSSGYGDWEQMILPGFVLAAGTMAAMLRLQRTSLLEVMEQPFILTARSQGLTPRRILWRHAVPNSWLAVVTLIGTYSVGILGGSIVIESIFSLPGLGSYVLAAIRGRDYPAIQGYVLFVGFLVILINWLVDLSYFFLNPRLRTGDPR